MRTAIKNYFQSENCKVLPPRVTVTKDATLEKIEELLVRPNTDGLLLYFDELARFMETMDQYRGSGGDRQAYLDLWSGSSVDVQRLGRGHVFTRRTALSMLGYIQPEKLSELLGAEMCTAIHGGDGFWIRWLFCTPPHIPDHYNELEGDITELMAETLAKVDKHLGEVGEDLLVLSEEARQLFIRTYNGWVDECKDKPLGFQGMSGKMKGYLARFSGLLHVIEWARSDSEQLPMTISVETMQRAVDVCLFFRRQYEMVMTNAGTTGLPQWVTRLELKVKSNNIEQVTASNLTKWRLAEDSKDAGEKICLLVDELGLGDKKKNRQGNWVWLPQAANTKASALMA